MVKGSAAVIAGGLGFGTGVAIATAGAPTGVAIAGGLALSTASAPSIALGTAKIIKAFQNDGTAKNVPTSTPEVVGIGLDNHFGNKKGELRNAGGVVDLATGAATAKGGVDMAVTAVSAVMTAKDAIGTHSSSLKTSGIQRDNTKTNVSPTNAPKVVNTTANAAAARSIADKLKKKENEN